jgi:hypothetical protein
LWWTFIYLSCCFSVDCGVDYDDALLGRLLKLRNDVAHAHTVDPGHVALVELETRSLARKILRQELAREGTDVRRRDRLVEVDMRLEFCGEAFRGVMHREDVNLIDTDEPIYDSIGRANDFTYDGVFELRYGAAGFRELDQAISGRYETGNNDRGVVGRILTDERLNGS